MKKLSIINLHKAEIKKNQLANIKGGIDIRCFCSTTNPYLTTKKSSGNTQMCVCDGTATSAGVYNRPQK